MRRILALILSAMVVVSLLAACGGASTPTPTATGTEAAATATVETETATPEATETETATATAAATEESSSSGGSPEVKEVTDKAAAAFKEIKTAHFEMAMEGQVGEEAATMTAAGDMQLPDRVHMTMDAMGMQLEVITIGNDSYTKIGDEWTKAESPAATTDPNDMVEDVGDLPDTGKRLADENIDGTDCYHLQYTGEDMKANNPDAEFGDAVVDIYIAKDTNLLKKMVIVSQGIGEADAGAKITMTFSKYNEPVSIEAPI